jgi:hypothetical protein
VESLRKDNLKHGSLQPKSVMIFNESASPSAEPQTWTLAAKISMNQHLPRMNLDSNLDVDLFGLAQIIHYCATQGDSNGLKRGRVTLSEKLSEDLAHLIMHLFNNKK